MKTLAFPCLAFDPTFFSFSFFFYRFYRRSLRYFSLPSFFPWTSYYFFLVPNLKSLSVSFIFKLQKYVLVGMLWTCWSDLFFLFSPTVSILCAVIPNRENAPRKLASRTTETSSVFSFFFSLTDGKRWRGEIMQKFLSWC